jgi:hypothetical protein
LRRNPFVSIAYCPQEERHFLKGKRYSNMLSKFQPTDTSLCIRDISRLGAKRRRRHSKTCEAVFETSGWSPVAKTKPRGLSYNYWEIKAIWRGGLKTEMPELSPAILF